MSDYGGLGTLVEEKEEPQQPQQGPSFSLSEFTSPHSVASNKSKFDQIATEEITSMYQFQSQELDLEQYQSTEQASHQHSHISPGMNRKISSVTDPSIKTSESASTIVRPTPIVETESLLPPLPNEEEDFNSNSNSNGVSTSNNSPIFANNGRFNHLMNDVDSSTTINSSFSNSLYAKDESTNTTNTANDFSDLFSDNPTFSNYELDSPSLNFDAKFQVFPSISTTSSNTASSTALGKPLSITTMNVAQPSAVTTPTASSNNTSPIKRLKSLKKGIRKLSLGTSSSNQATANSSASTTIDSQRPNLYPLQTNTSRPQEEESTSIASYKRHSHNSSHSSTDSSSCCSSSSQNPSKINQLHISLSQGGNGVARVTTRKHSNPNPLLTPLTPPLSSPIITLSENLSSSKKALSTIEKSYFDSLNSKNPSTNPRDPSQLFFNNVFGASTSENSKPTRERISSISELESAEDLIKYSIYLKQQKKSICDAFEMTKNHLNQSGWCSEHDINNLQLQQDSQRCQIDTKILQIEERLNEEFGMSSLHNETGNRRRSGKSSFDRVASQDKKDLPISPSLKVLESRSFSFVDLS